MANHGKYKLHKVGSHHHRTNGFFQHWNRHTVPHLCTFRCDRCRCLLPRDVSGLEPLQPSHFRWSESPVSLAKHSNDKDDKSGAQTTCKTSQHDRTRQSQAQTTLNHHSQKQKAFVNQYALCEARLRVNVATMSVVTVPNE